MIAMNMNHDFNPIRTEFSEVVAVLREGGLNFLLVGGLSLLAHHVERATGGIDFVCEANDRELAAKVMLRLGYSILNENPKLYSRFHRADPRVVDFTYVNPDTFAQLEESAVETEVSQVLLETRVAQPTTSGFQYDPVPAEFRLVKEVFNEGQHDER